jgi:hypothetical protein
MIRFIAIEAVELIFIVAAIFMIYVAAKAIFKAFRNINKKV